MMFEAYVTNLGLYPEYGVEAGEPLRFPATEEEVQSLFSRIGIDGERYSEYFITSYDSDINGLCDCLGEYERLDELNYLAHLLKMVHEQGEMEKLEAVIAFGEHTDSVPDLINLTQNLDGYSFYSGIEDEEALGRYFAEDLGAINIPDHIQDYFDYEAYGRDINLNSSGDFVQGGYVLSYREPFREFYTGREDIPEEYQISDTPAHNGKEETRSIIETIKQYKETPSMPQKDKAGFSHEER